MNPLNEEDYKSLRDEEDYKNLRDEMYSDPDWDDKVTLKKEQKRYNRNHKTLNFKQKPIKRIDNSRKFNRIKNK